MKKCFAGFMIGLVLGISGVGNVFAANTIKSANFNDSRIKYNDKEIDLSEQPMISVVKTDEEGFRNYIPLRTALEQMGFGVYWYSDLKIAEIYSEEYIKDSSEWIKYDEVIKRLNANSDDYPNRWHIYKYEPYPYPNSYYPFGYEEEDKIVGVTFDVKHNWSIVTIVFGDDIYVKKENINYAMNTIYYGSDSNLFDIDKLPMPETNPEN